MSLVVPFYVHHLEVDYGILQVPSCTWLALARPCETPGEMFHERIWDRQSPHTLRPAYTETERERDQSQGNNIQGQFKRQGFRNEEC